MGTTGIIVTTTGSTNVCDAGMLKTIKSGAVVCSIGHFDNEIDTAFMRENWKFEEVKPQVHKVYRAADLNKSDFVLLLSEGRLNNTTGHLSCIMGGSFAN
jgi:adenosylhomocysteinase